MINKTQMLALLKEEFNRWDTLLTSLNEAQLTVPVNTDKMSIKDTMAHLMVWQQLSIARLEAAQHDREPILPAWPEDLDSEPEGEPHDMNAWIYASHRNDSWQTVLQAWHSGFLRFLELAEAISETDLLAVGKYHWLEQYPLVAVLEGSYKHHREHWDTVSEWLGAN